MRDLFGISSPELDALVEIAAGVDGRVSARGSPAPASAAARSTWCAAMPSPALREAVERDYGPRTGLHARVFEVEPSRGAAVLRG